MKRELLPDGIKYFRRVLQLNTHWMSLTQSPATELQCRQSCIKPSAVSYTVRQLDEHRSRLSVVTG